MSLRKLTTMEEAAFIKEVYGEEYSAVCGYLRESFALLQARSQMLLGLATICLTITGFSGPRMAQSNPFSRFFLAFGLMFVLASVTALALGPLRLRWITAWRGETLDETLIANLRWRDSKTRLYRSATILLLTGLTGYLMSLIFYLISVPA